MTFAQFLKLFIYARFSGRQEQYQYDYFYLPRIVCIDGFSVSLQVNNGNYCESENGYRQLGLNWANVEFGFTSTHEPMFAQFAENEDDTTGTVGSVPMHVIESCLLSHGGIDIEATLESLKF